jgi:hypothetical protein
MRYREIIQEAFGYSQDNPALRSEDGKQWLARKQAAAEEAHDNASRPRGIDYYYLRGPVTATMGCLSPMYFSAKLINLIPGCMDEHRRPGEGQFDSLIKRVEENGFDFSPENAVLVGVNHKGHAYVIEGNTRAAVAAHLGIKDIACEFRWYNGAELVDGDWSPSRVAGLGIAAPIT